MSLPFQEFKHRGEWLARVEIPTKEVLAWPYNWERVVRERLPITEIRWTEPSVLGGIVAFGPLKGCFIDDEP